MVDWSGFAIEVRKFRASQLPREAILELRNRILNAQASLESIDTMIEKHISTTGQVKEVKSTRQDPIFDTVFEFTEFHLSVAMVFHASYALALGQMLASLPQDDTRQDCTAVGELWIQRSRLLNRLCRSYEYAWKHRPLGSSHMFGPLVIAFPLGETEEMKAWILKALNDLDAHRYLEKPRFTAESISYLSGIMTGQHAPVVLDHS
jgi:hypothetical protein